MRTISDVSLNISSYPPGPQIVDLFWTRCKRAGSRAIMVRGHGNRVASLVCEVVSSSIGAKMLCQVERP